MPPSAQPGLVPRRFATKEELLELLRRLGAELGRTPTARDLDERRGTMPSKSLYWHTFGSLSVRFAKQASTSRSARSGSSGRSSQGAELAVELGRLPRVRRLGDRAPCRHGC